MQLPEDAFTWDVEYKKEVLGSGKERKVGSIRYEARSRGRSSLIPRLFEPAKIAQTIKPTTAIQ